MRFLPMLALCAAPAFSFAQSKDFKIDGELKNIPSATTIYLNYASEGKRITDSADVTNGKYAFSGTLSEPVEAMLRVKFEEGTSFNRSKDAAMVYLDQSPMTFVSTDSFSNIKVSGSDAHVAYLKLNEQLKPFNEQMNALNENYRSLMQDGKKEEAQQLVPKAQEIQKGMGDVYKNYATNNPKSPLALYAISSFAGYDIDPVVVEPLFNALPASAKSSPAGKTMATKLETAKKTAIGQPAIQFTQNDTLGNPISLASFKGKYVLVDFWASWCGPCRAENPNVVKAFEAYKDKGFTVLGVSLDQPGAKDKWMQAIHKDNLTWTQVSDLEGWNNAAAKLYGIQAIPQNLLLDPNGIIIAKNIRGEALQEKLAELIQ